MQNNDYYSSDLVYEVGDANFRSLITVCLSTYKVSDSVTQALKTILNQTIDDYEVVIQDDCSPDNTIDVVVAYLKSHTGFTARRVRVYRSNENCGILTNRLKGFAHAAGDWFVMTDGDDFSPPDRLEKTKKMLLSLDAGTELVVTNRYDWEVGTSYEDVVNGKCRMYDFGDSYFVAKDIINDVHPQGSNGFIVSRHLFETFKGSIPKARIICDDPVLAHRATLIGKIFIFGEPVFYCRISPTSASKGGSREREKAYDVCNRCDLLAQDIAHVSKDGIVPSGMLNRLNHIRTCASFDATMTNCSIFVWPLYWLRLRMISKSWANTALRKRLRLIFTGSVNGSLRKRFGLKNNVNVYKD